MALGTAEATDLTVTTASPLTFAGTAGETQMIDVTIVGDLIVEDNETFTITLGNVSNTTAVQDAAITTGAAAVGTIDNDDTAEIWIEDVSLNEGATGVTNFVFTIHSTLPIEENVTVDWATADGTATIADNDYTAANGTATLTPNGSSESTTTVTIQVIGDIFFEPDETFTVNLSNPRFNGAVDPSRAIITDPTGLGTILNDDSENSILVDASGNLLIAGRNRWRGGRRPHHQ